MNEKINEISIALLQTQRSHIDTLLAIIKHLQKEMKLSLKCDHKERVQIINELIWWINKLFEGEGQNE
jgi:hypothetical protein